MPTYTVSRQRSSVSSLINIWAPMEITGVLAFRLVSGPHRSLSSQPLLLLFLRLRDFMRVIPFFFFSNTRDAHSPEPEAIDRSRLVLSYTDTGVHFLERVSWVWQRFVWDIIILKHWSFEERNCANLRFSLSQLESKGKNSGTRLQQWTNWMTGTCIPEPHPHQQVGLQYTALMMNWLFWLRIPFDKGLRLKEVSIGGM